MTTSHAVDIRLVTEEKLKGLLKEFSEKKPRVDVKSGLTGFSRNLDTLSWEELTDTEFQPIGMINGSSVVVYRTEKSVGYGTFDETAYTIVISDIISLILQIMPEESEDVQELYELNLLVENMERLLK